MRTKHELIVASIHDQRARYLLEQDDKPWYIPPETRKLLIMLADHTCAICGKRVKNDSLLHIDHKHPVSKGGKATYENLQVLCQYCNLSKSDHFIDVSSYKKGYVIPIYVPSERSVIEEILRRVESELY